MPNVTFLQLRLKQYFMQGNPFYITTSNRGSKKEKETLMLPRLQTMGLMNVNYCFFLCWHYLLNTLIRIILGSEAEKLKKKFQKLFKEKDLDIAVQCNLKITNYLDITLNLNDSSYHPYRKPTEETKYIHVSSGHLLLFI